MTARRLVNAVESRLMGARASLLLNPGAIQAGWKANTHEHADNRVHLLEALQWLARAQAATPDDGFARGYCLTWNRYFKARGWQPSYPETTGYIIPTLYSAARFLGDPSWAARATRAAYWEIDVQLDNGAVQGGVIGQPRSPAIFNTGQVIFGWLAALDETGDSAFEAALRRAGDFLVSVEKDGDWISGNSAFARKDATAYNARAAWALAEAGVRLGVTEYQNAAKRILCAVAARQQTNGWFPSCCLNNPSQPLLHTIAYTVRGLIEGGRVLNMGHLTDAGMKTAAALLLQVRADGWLPGRLEADWRPAVEWSCLTGNAQTANNWIRLYEITGDAQWLRHVHAVLGYLKQRQNRTSRNGGLRGGIAGSSPLGGRYGSYEILNWATKYFADAMMRELTCESGDLPMVSHLA